jgi:hypothetical protein
MKHVKRYKELFESQTELSKEQIKWLKKCTEGKWTLNPQTGLVDVDGSFDCSSQNLTDFKGVRFGVVTEHFYCYYNELPSLKGAPQEVGGYFDCFHNELTSLEGAPKKVGGDFRCSSNKLTSLKDAPQKVEGYFDCSYNNLTSLKHAPKKVGKGFRCDRNALTSLKGAPKKVVLSFDCNHNELTSLKDAPQEVGERFDCSYNKLTSLEGAPKKVGWRFAYSDNPVSESVLKALYMKMQSGMSWPDVVAKEWDSIESGEDKILLAPSNPNLSPEELKGYQALARLKRRSI